MGFFKKIFKAITAPFKAVINLVTGLISGVVSAFTGNFGVNFDSPDYASSSAESIQGVLVNKDSAISDIPVVYGTRQVGGIRVFVATSTTSNEYLYVAYVLSEGQVNGYTKLIVDDNTVTIGDYSHGVRSFATSGNYGQESRLEVQFFDGRDDQISSTLLQEAPGWTSNHKLSGLAYIACKFRWKKIDPASASANTDAINNPYGGGVPRVVVQLEGKKVYDVKTVGATHTTAYASETVSFTNNPVSILLDYMRNPRYGKALENDYFDWASWKTAATLCDQVVNYTDTTTGKAFTCDAVVDTGSTLMDNVKKLLIGFRGIMPYQQGLYVMKIEHGGDDTDIDATPAEPAVVFTATVDNTVPGISIQGDSKQTRCNRARITYVDPDSDYQPNEVIYPSEGSADDVAYMAQDGVRLEKTMTLDTVANREQALQFAEVFVKRSRNAKQVQFATNMAGSNVTVGDLIKVTNARLGLDGIFRVMDIRINEDAQIEFTGFEHQSSAYAVNAKTAGYTRPTLSLPNPYLVIAPTAVTVQSGAAFNIDNGAGYLADDSSSRRLYVSWTASADPYVRDYIVQFKKSTDTDFVYYAMTTTASVYIHPVTLGAIYNVRVAARNELDNRSAFATATAHTVIS
jgi:hypothetical protein